VPPKLLPSFIKYSARCCRKPIHRGYFRNHLLFLSDAAPRIIAGRQRPANCPSPDPFYPRPSWRNRL